MSVVVFFSAYLSISRFVILNLTGSKGGIGLKMCVHTHPTHYLPSSPQCNGSVSKTSASDLEPASQTAKCGSFGENAIWTNVGRTDGLEFTVD